MAQMNIIGLLAGNKEEIQDKIKLPSKLIEENLVNTLHKSIENAYKNFQVDVKKALMNEKKENWRTVNLDYFKKIEEKIRDSEFWAECISR